MHVGIIHVNQQDRNNSGEIWSRIDFRCAKLSLVLLTGCKSRSGEGSGRSLVRANHPPVSSVAPLADSVVNGRETVANVNNRGEAYTENLAGQRGVAPP